ncbi:coiled-coil domain-containing protein 130 homolog [Thalassophryne amazonica]|uniref:coiled-coil domain-containing protein 130 homolog n=1 Tax=Thalassophryne amazonica TaxID=390379 RepID=UPI001470D64F|nr:coiled-coil domain-containing protein 130 homolog [Thalassophryne amazonica]
MGERKGTNKYYPPDFDPAKHGSLNGYHNTHPLRERARKLSKGILIIRFEMPYNIWCDGCKNHIGMGVRYNAEKKKVGNYYTTPIYRFRMKCHLCVNYIEMQTDPATCDYVIVSGAQRKEERWDMAENEQILTTERAEKEKLETDAMFKLEHSGKDKQKLVKALPSLSEIQDHQSRWKDDFDLNSFLRKKFREERKVLAEQEEKDNAFRMKANVSIPLLPETAEDNKLAELLTYQAPESCEETERRKRNETLSRPWFSSSPAPVGGAAGVLLHKLGLQGKRMAAAKALGSSHIPLIRRHTDGSGNKPELCATVSRRRSDPEPDTRDGVSSEAAPGAAAVVPPTRVGQKSNSELEIHVKTTEDGCLIRDCGRMEEEGQSSGGVSSLVPEYSDSDSESG